MQCTSCGAPLQGPLTFCGYCGVRQNIDLRRIPFQNFGTDATLPCPGCSRALEVIEFDTDPAIRIERCSRCFGLFFNPGEIEVLLETHGNPLVRFDPAQLQQIASDFGSRKEILCRRCPVCSERMSPFNFGGSSGVIVDRCGTHGIWLEGGTLRRLLEWWGAGGKLIYQQHEAGRAKQRFEAPAGHRPGIDAVPPTETTPEFLWEKSDETAILSSLVQVVRAILGSRVIG